MTLPSEPTPLRVEQLSKLGCFLANGFGQPIGTPPFTDGELRWKYFAPLSLATGPRSFVVEVDGAIVGHIGLCPRFLVPPRGLGEAVATVHPIDWIAAKDRPGVGLDLMSRVFESAPTQNAMGGTAIADKLQVRLGYRSATPVRAFRRVLRPSYRFRGAGKRTLGKVARFGNDVARATIPPWRRPGRHVEAVPVGRFGPEVDELVDRCEYQIGFTTRSAELLNYYLQHPRGTFTGWMLVAGDRPLGFALLNVMEQDGVVGGRIVECFLTRGEARDWAATVAALTRELARQAADHATCLASTPWLEEALRTNGYTGRVFPDFRLRDPGKVFPTGATLHVSLLEADHAYL